MKFLHLGDLHLGKRIYGYSMLEDQYAMLGQVVQMAQLHQVDAVIIAGDIYDKPVPPSEAVGLFDSFFTALCNQGIAVLAISGNHDSGIRLNFGRSLLARQGIYLCGTLADTVQAVTLCDTDGCTVQFHLLPWFHPMELREKFGCSSQQGAFESVLSQLEWDDNARHVLIAHAFVTVGGALPEQSESEIIPVGGLDAVDAALFDRFDYTALGHIHRPQRLGHDNVRYAGSLMKYSFSEARYPKSVPLVTIHTDGEPEIELLPLHPPHEMREIRGKLEDVISDCVVHAGNPEDYIRVILTDEEELYDPHRILKKVYPNLMRLDFDNARTRAADTENFPKRETVHKKSCVQLLAQLFIEQNGKEMSAWQYETAQEIYTAMEDTDETD